MKYSQLAAFLTVLLSAFGEVSDGTHFQEDCAGGGALSTAVSHFNLKALRRDVPWVKKTIMFESSKRIHL